MLKFYPLLSSKDSKCVFSDSTYNVMKVDRAFFEKMNNKRDTAANHESQEGEDEEKDQVRKAFRGK